MYTINEIKEMLTLQNRLFELGVSSNINDKLKTIESNQNKDYLKANCDINHTFVASPTNERFCNVCDGYFTDKQQG